MKRILVLLSLLVGPVVLASSQSVQPAAGANEPKVLADKAMRYLASNDLKGMFNYIQTIMPIEQAELDKIRETSITQRKMFPSTLGAYVG